MKAFSSEVKESLDVVNSISLNGAILTCVILLLLGYFKYHLIDRVSLRIQGMIALIDVARHLSLFKSTHANDNLCKFIAFLVFFTDQLYVLLNVVIAINIQYIFLRNKRPKEKLHWVYCLVSFALAATMNFFPLAAGVFGLNKGGRCRMMENKDIIWWHIFLVYFGKSLGAIYCLVIYILVLLKVIRRKEQLRLVRGSENSYGSDPMKFLWTLYSRVALYPLTCFITMFPLTLTILFSDITHDIPDDLNILFPFFLRITGTLNFVTMLFDPHCQNAIMFLWRTLFSLKPLRYLGIHLKLSSLKEEIDLASPYYNELEYPNGDRIQMREYVRLL